MFMMVEIIFITFTNTRRLSYSFLFQISNIYEPLHEKTCFFICENKEADQLSGNRTADQRLCFRYIDSTIPLLLNPKVRTSYHLLRPYSPVCVGPG